MHFAFDDKFIPLVQQLYEEAFPGGNQFRILHPSSQSFRFVKPEANVSCVSERYFRSDALSRDYENSDCLVVHAMIPAFAEGVQRAPENVLVVWSGWGFDYYDILEKQFGQLLLPETRFIAKMLAERERGCEWMNPKLLLTRVKRKTSNLLRLISRKAPRIAASLSTVADRIDLYSVLPDEIDMVRKALPTLCGRHHMLNYYSTEDIFEVGPVCMSGPDILLGNSANAENNHVEVLKVLRSLEMAGRKIIVPLSYGSGTYADEICRIGRDLFGSSFVPLREFLPLQTYNQILASCGTVIMNHRRQQAIGNISAALYKGARVYLRPENPVFRFYSGMGVTLAKVDDLTDRRGSAFRPLDPLVKKKNRKLVGEFWSRERVVANIRDLQKFSRGSAAHVGTR